MRVSVIGLACLVAACHGGEPRGHSDIIGAWCVEGRPVYFHPSGTLDDGELDRFPEAWFRDGSGRLRIGTSIVHETRAGDELTLAWDAGAPIGLRRTDYAVVRDGGDAGVCDP